MRFMFVMFATRSLESGAIGWSLHPASGERDDGRAELRAAASHPPALPGRLVPRSGPPIESEKRFIHEALSAHGRSPPRRLCLADVHVRNRIGARIATR
jgi:hypothetical protein